MSIDIAIVGTPFLDLTFDGLPHLPHPGEEVLARTLRVGPGGAGMQAIGAARLGLSVALVGPLGSDFAGRMLREMFGKEGVQVVDVRTQATATTALLSTRKGVAMATALGDGEPTGEDVRAAGATAFVLSLGRLGLAPNDAEIYAVTGGLELPGVDQEVLARLGTARAFVANAREAAVLTGDRDPEGAARRLASFGGTVVVTLGPDGAVAAAGDQIVRRAGHRMEVRDATGAGDLFVAAYVWADLRGATLRARLDWATLYAALSVAEPTAMEGAVRLEQLLDAGRARGLTPP